MPVEDQGIYRAKFMNELHPDTLEDLPPDLPNPKGQAFQISCFFDPDHGG